MSHRRERGAHAARLEPQKRPSPRDEGFQDRAIVLLRGRSPCEIRRPHAGRCRRSRSRCQERIRAPVVGLAAGHGDLLGLVRLSAQVFRRRACLVAEMQRVYT